MFNFFKRAKNTTKPENQAETPERRAQHESVARADTNERRKDVVNLLLPETDYNQKTGVSGLLQHIMAGKKRKSKRKNIVRAESCREMSPQREISIQRRNSEVEAASKNIHVDEQREVDDANFVKELVLQKYKTPVEEKRHVSLVYVEHDPEYEKKHAESLLREIARSIDCTIVNLEKNNDMGISDSKNEPPRVVGRNERWNEPVYEAIDDKEDMVAYKSDLKDELEKLMDDEKTGMEADNKPLPDIIDSPGFKKKSNLKVPKTETEISDDDRSDCSKKRVTFRKHVVFDDGDEQTDDDLDSFESITDESDSEEVRVSEKVDNSDSGFLECDREVSEEETGTESETDEEVSVSEEEGVVIAEIIEPADDIEKNLVSQDSKFQSQVTQLTELADARCDESERMRDQIYTYRKEIETKDQEIEQLKCELAAAYKESELIRQRSRSLEEELSAARTCSADLAGKLAVHNGDTEIQLRSELQSALARGAELESRLQALERERNRLEQEKRVQEQKAQEALSTAEANTAKWRSAHEAARSQAAARAERMLADCEWKMRELEKKARDTDKLNTQLTKTIEQLKTDKSGTETQIAELQQLRGLATEQQRSVQALTMQLQRVETREEALKLEVHRLKDLLEREGRISKEKDERYLQTIERLEQQHNKSIETLKSEHTTTIAQNRAHLERAHAERTRAALSQLRADSDKEMRNADRKLREVTTRFENLKETLQSKEAQFNKEIAEAHSKADWELLQLRHLLDKADITYANNMEKANEKFEREKEMITEEWSLKLKQIEREAATAADEAGKLLENTKLRLIAERNDQVNRLKEQHRQEMDEQWEQFMNDKENCLTRMKAECRQEGEEERVKREKDLLEEIAELKSQIQSKSCDFDNLAVKAAACGRTLAVTEQELREALAREKELRGKRSEDATKIKQAERASREQIEHLTRKCACLRKLFDDMRARLSSRDKIAEQEAKAKDKELHQLRAEVARLTKILVEQSSPKLGARTRADGCDDPAKNEESFFSKDAPLASDTQASPPRRKGGGTLRTPEFLRKRAPFGELAPIPTELRPKLNEMQDGRRRAKSVDLPAVQVPVRIKQLEDKIQ